MTGTEESDAMPDSWAEPFERARPQLRAVAYRMLGSLADAEDAVQEAWLRLDGTDAAAVNNIDAWLTTVVARICLNILRARRTRPQEESLPTLPDPVIDRADDVDPEHQALLADSVGLALFIVLDRLAPAERLAFVLHDVFAVPFDDIAPIVDRSVQATRKLASRARQRIQSADASPDGDLAAQRTVVDAFFAAARDGDFDQLLAALHPDVVLHGDFGPGDSRTERGADAVARLAGLYARGGGLVHPATVNGAAGAVITMADRVAAVMGFVVVGGKITEIDVLAEPRRLSHLDVSAVIE
ncbi:sigma-70 family RNA polymerase sigma factor [Mycolicibacterium brisbanense]|uniref:RNA polymerase ECF-subfamily protein sigma factor n=1 Tax=Mycolicibacterium brisbanense TaxID=146020 RepID=A0A117I3V5_9MYCO|nr:sigma-70 family RNA polymerase sigma factor [Mycolicibacterium brisbanense]MCV7160439.1 sigma-70 family RNA polymerase sigma factor [Mycolicibacterium brisbanense]GAS85965.1 RNA polymerase ECF-subfamily protein sigma factor [Mycolicibacterium brisbanense]